MKNYIVGVVIGICIAIIGGAIFAGFSFNSRLNALESFSIQVANLINSSNKQATPAK